MKYFLLVLVFYSFQIFAREAGQTEITTDEGIEVFKKENVVDGKVFYSISDRLDTNNILKFY